MSIAGIGGVHMRKTFLSVLIFSLFAIPCFSQETPTEREAARDVVKQIGALSQSLGVQSMVAKLSGTDQGRDEVIARVKQLMQSELQPMSDWSTHIPRMGFQKTHRSPPRTQN